MFPAAEGGLVAQRRSARLAWAVAPLAVGVLTFPLSLVADRWGRARSVAVMALTWSLATIACGLAATYGPLFASRLVLGIGEAGYGSVGLAVVFTYFPRRMRASITSAFMAAGLFGSVLGLMSGGLIAARFGWRAAFVVIAVFGLALSCAYLFAAPESRLWRKAKPAETAEPAPVFAPKAIAAAILGRPQVVLTYVASGLQLFIAGAMTAWTPSYINRVYGIAPSKAAVIAAGFLLLCGLGMIGCGRLCDRLCRDHLQRAPYLAVAFCLVSFAALQGALAAGPGPAQIALASIGFFFAAGVTGPAGLVVSEGTPPALHGASLAVLTLANNLIGFAPGAAVTGFAADHFGLPAALKIAVATALPAAALFYLSARAPTSKPRPKGL